MIVKDEAHCIERCLNSLIRKVSRICIVDTGSTDNTLGILDYYSRAHIHTHWQIEKASFVDFSTARNHSIRMAVNAGWIFIIDADELVLPESWVAIHELLFSTPKPPISVALPRHQWTDMEMTHYIGPYPDHHIRIWQNGRGVQYQGKVHEQPCGGQVWDNLVYLDTAHIEHFNRAYRSGDGWAKINQLYKQLSQ